MIPPRLRIVLPIALLFTVCMPLLRTLPAGSFYPDLLMLLLLVVTPAKVENLRRAALLVFLFGLLRASVSTISIFSCWAGLGLGLAFRALVHPHISDHRLFGRLTVGCLSAAPLILFDLHQARLFEIAIDEQVFMWRVLNLGILWAIFQTPVAFRFKTAGAS